MRIPSLGRPVFAAAMIGLGIFGLVRSDYTAVSRSLSKGFPFLGALLYMSPFVSLACGVGLFWRRTAVHGARLLFVYELVWMLLYKVRIIVLYPGIEVAYQNWGESAVLVAASWVLYAWFAGDGERNKLGFAAVATGDSGVRMARALYALALIAFGLSHFAYLENTASLVPAWLHAPVGWSYFTGAAYLAAALAMLTGVWARLAAVLSAVQMGGFTLLVWVPLAVSGQMKPSQWNEFVVSGALTAGAWVVADSYRGTSWLTTRKGIKGAV